MQSDNAIPVIEFGGDGPSLHFAMPTPIRLPATGNSWGH